MNKYRIFLLVSILLVSSAEAAFMEKGRRYLSPSDILHLLEQKFPVMSNVQKMGTIKQGCWSIRPTNFNLIGVVNPVVGAPASPQPGTGFVRWLATCAEKIISRQSEELLEQRGNNTLWLRFFPPSILSYRNQIDSKSWSSLPAKVREEISRNLVEYMIGPEPVVQDLGCNSTQQLIDMVVQSTEDNQETSIISEIRKILLGLSLREEFLSY